MKNSFAIFARSRFDIWCQWQLSNGKSFRSQTLVEKMPRNEGKVKIKSFWTEKKITFHFLKGNLGVVARLHQRLKSTVFYFFQSLHLTPLNCCKKFWLDCSLQGGKQWVFSSNCTFLQICLWKVISRIFWIFFPDQYLSSFVQWIPTFIEFYFSFIWYIVWYG